MGDMDVAGGSSEIMDIIVLDIATVYIVVLFFHVRERLFKMSLATSSHRSYLFLDVEDVALHNIMCIALGVGAPVHHLRPWATSGVI